jgi:hypothetical protein
MSGFAGMFAAGGITSVVATGGQTIYDGTGTLAGYRFHAFTANGTFTVSSNDAGKTFDAVLVGGGGGSGNQFAGPSGSGGGGGAVTEVTGIALSTSTAYPVIIGNGGTQAPAAPTPGQLGTPGGASIWNGYSAAGGIRGLAPAGGTSGNGYGGGATNTPVASPGQPLGGGGGGAGGGGLSGTIGIFPSPVQTPAPGNPEVPYYLNGGGGIGYKSAIDGNIYGAGGGGGPNWSPLSVYTANPNFANSYTPTTTAFDKITYSVTYGNEFVPGGGGVARSPGVNGKGGGAGGYSGGPPAINNQFNYGGSGRVVIRYPYITPPGEPTNLVATPGNGEATITFNPPVADGGSSILDYTVTSFPGNITVTGSGSPITITGLTNGTTYTFRIKARNGTGSSSNSDASNSVIPGASSVITSVIATGGQTIYDGTGSFAGYRFHEFTSNGTFTITNNPTNQAVTVLLVGGGGGSGYGGPIQEGFGGAGGGAITEVPTLNLTSNTSYTVIVGSGGTNIPGSPVPVTSDGNYSHFFGYKAAGGLKSASLLGGASGNGNASGGLPAGSSGTRNGSGGGGAGGAGNLHRDWGPPTAPPASFTPIYVPRFSAGNFPTPYATYYATGRYNGGGGIGYTSPIDGNTYGAGGGGGHVNGTPLPSWWNGKYTPEAVPNAQTLFTSGGGGLAASPGVNGKGGGAGGPLSGPPQFYNGGSGKVVIRYPYP